MHIVAGILVLIVGIVFPMGMLFWLNSRLNRKPSLRPGRVGLLLALNGVLPVGLVTSGLGLMSPRLWAAPWLRVVTVMAWIAVLVILVALLLRRGGG